MTKRIQTQKPRPAKPRDIETDPRTPSGRRLPFRGGA